MMNLQRRWQEPRLAGAALGLAALLLMTGCADLEGPVTGPVAEHGSEQPAGEATAVPVPDDSGAEVSEPGAPGSDPAGPGTSEPAAPSEGAGTEDPGDGSEPAGEGDSETPAAGDVVWSDEFEGAAGTAPDPDKWRLETGGEGWGNGEREYYTDSTDNAALDGDGNLVITAREGNPEGFTCWYGPCTHTSARMNTAGRFSQAYGRFEARIKIPTGQGVWPAFWMLGDNFADVGWPASGEIDIMENIGSEPGTVHGTVHGPGYSGGAGVGGSTTLSDGAAFTDDFHVYAVDWTPEQITWSVDGVAYQAVTPGDIGGNTWAFDHPFFLILNVAVGGQWPGDPDDTTSFPQEMVVDYVRVHEPS